MSASNEKGNLEKNLFKAVNKVPREKKVSLAYKTLNGIGWFFLTSICMMKDQVPDVIIVLLYSED